MLYVIILILLIWVGVLALVNIRAIRGDNYSRLIAILLDTPIVLIAVTLFLLFDPGGSLVQALYIGMGVVAELLLIGWLTGKLNKTGLIILLALLTLLIGGRIACGQQAQYERAITVSDSFDARDYRPFREGSLVKTLDEPSTLKLTDDLPRMDGATALFPVYAAFAQAVYPASIADLSAAEQYEIIDCGTTSVAYRDIVNGNADIIFVAGPSAEQEEYAKENGVELIYTPIGREALVFFVNPKNPLDSITLSQIRGIYSGQITKWDELGVKGLGTIRAFQRSIGSGSQTALEKLMGDTPLMDAPTETRMGSMFDIVEATADYKNFINAIGYSFRFYCTELVRDVEVKLLAVNGVAPTKENIENGTYPIASYFYAVTRSDADENTLALLAWIQGPQGQELIEKTGYTPVSAER